MTVEETDAFIKKMTEFHKDFVPSCYILERRECNPKGDYSQAVVIGLDIDCEILRSCYVSNDFCTWREKYGILRQDKNESDEEFLLKCSVMGCSPDFERRSDQCGTEKDFIEIKTGISLVAKRKKAIEQKCV